MTDIFVVRNQLGPSLGKSQAWVDGSVSRLEMRTQHEDDAINTLFELSSKDVELRGEVIASVLTERGDPVIEPSQIPLLEEPELEEEQAKPEFTDEPQTSVTP